MEKKAREEMEGEGKHKRGKKTEEEGRRRKAGEERKDAKSRKRREEKIKKRRRSTLRVLPAETRLTVYRRFNISLQGEMSWNHSLEHTINVKGPRTP